MATRAGTGHHRPTVFGSSSLSVDFTQFQIGAGPPDTVALQTSQGPGVDQRNRPMRIPPTATMPAMTTKTFEALPRNLATAGTLWLAYLGMRWSTAAITGPASDSIKAKILGFRIAATQVVRMRKALTPIFTARSLMRFRCRSTMVRAIAVAPSAAPSQYPKKDEAMAAMATAGPSQAIIGLSMTLAGWESAGGFASLASCSP